MVEVLYQIGDRARYVIVSENEEALDGWPYDKVIGAFVKDPTRPAGELASSAVDAYIDPVQNEKAPKINTVYTASLIDTEGFKKLIPRLEALANELRDILPLEIKNILVVDRLTNTSDGYIDNVHTLRDTYKADEVVLLVANSDYCGLAWLMTTLWP